MIFSPHDLTLIAQKLTKLEYAKRINPFAFSGEARVKSRWNQNVESLRSWGQIPLVQDRINTRISGRSDTSFRELVCQNFLNDKIPRTALSLGCGFGGREIEWGKLGVFTQLTGVDISPLHVKTATENAQAAGVSDRVTFIIADVNKLSLDGQKYDAIIFEHSLHHFNKMPELLTTIRTLLNPGGLLIVDEYVGPRRFQWTRRQLAFADAVLDVIPEAHRRIGTRRVKTRNVWPGEVLMWLNDPSEAVESDRIEPEIERLFKILHHADYGGTISHLIFHDIAFHYVTDDPDVLAWATMVLDAEDALLNLNILRSDFTTYVCTV